MRVPSRRFFNLIACALAALLTGCGATATKPVDAGSPAKLSLSASSFDFGSTVLPETARRAVVTVTNTGGESASLTDAISGAATLKLEPGLSCGPTLAAGGSCLLVAAFTPVKPGAVSGQLTVTSNLTTQMVALTGTGVQLSGGQSLVSATANPLVARYDFQPEQSGRVAVEFGKDTGYGRQTGTVTAPANGGPVSILVAGMEADSTYHMRAVVTASDGTVARDQDHTFSTSHFAAATLPQLQVTARPGVTPQPGIELNTASLSAATPSWLEAYSIDLQGNIVWGYNFPDRSSPNTIVQPIKLMPNGNMLVVLSFASQFLLPGQGLTLTAADQSVDLIREVDLAGDPVAQITISQLNAKLAAAGYNSITLLDLHHDVTLLPNGDIIVIGAVLKAFQDLTGYPGTTNVLGDVLVDLDASFNVAWVWNEFDHLDVNRHPMNFPDWTHTNAVIYSPDDGNLLVSLRHQDWIVKVDYENGAGNGDVLWRLGNGGDFRLVDGTAPTSSEDWFYAQHAPSFASAATSGQFSLALMDNGDNRILASGATCGASDAPCYTTVPILAVDEAARTATIAFRQTLPPALYSEWGGDAVVLPNGNIEYDLCAEPNGSGSIVNEVTTGANPHTVWSLKETGANLYRAERLPSLYPGVQW